MIGPGATAFLVSARFGRMMGVAMAVAIGCAVAGVLLSFHADVAPGPLIVVLQAGVFCLAFVFAPGRGLLAHARVRRAAAVRNTG